MGGAAVGEQPVEEAMRHYREVASLKKQLLRS